MAKALMINPTAFEAGLIAAARARGLDGARLSALENFAAKGLPHRRVEEWKWTDLRAALRAAPAADPANDVIAPSVFGGLGAFEITVMNGEANWTGEAPAGVAIETSAAPALSAQAAAHPLAALAFAMCDEVLRIRVEPGAAPDHPILLRRIAGGGAVHQRAVVEIGAGARATVIESFDGAGEYFANSVTEYNLADGANLSRIVLQNGSDAGVDASLASIACTRDCELHQTALLLGAKAARVETRIEFGGDGAKAVLNSASLLNRARHADFTSQVTHHAERCETRQLHRAALAGRSHGVFQGKFLVARGAQQTDSTMAANALLLSDEAEASHKPELEIYADDVQCAHGSTAGALDDDALFYMRQRGLDADAARALLIEAFVGEVFDDTPHPAVAQIFRARLARWLETGI